VQVHRRRIKAAAAAAELVNFHLRSASERFLVIVIAVAGSRLAVAEPCDAKIQLTQTIALPGVEGQMDYFDFDAAGGRVFPCSRSVFLDPTCLERGSINYLARGISNPMLAL
jgi:hypothetical protein